MNLGATFPDLHVETTHGKLSLHEYFGENWGILFSHPADFTPICTTELSIAQRYMPEFEKRKVKMVALSCDPVESHHAWVQDIGAFAPDLKLGKAGLGFPIVADPSREIATQLGMLDEKSKNAEGLPNTCRAVFIVGPDKKLKLQILYPATTGRNFDEIIRVVDSLQLTAAHRLATPGNWKNGDPCFIATSVAKEEADKIFPGYKTVEVPSGKKYLRTTAWPLAKTG